MDPLTPARLSCPRRSLHLSHELFRSFPLQPHPDRPVASIGSTRAPTDLRRSPQASPQARRLARSTCRIEFTFVRDQSSASGCSPPRIAATQLPSAAHRSLPPAGSRLSLTEFMFSCTHEPRRPRRDWAEDFHAEPKWKTTNRIKREDARTRRSDEENRGNASSSNESDTFLS